MAKIMVDATPIMRPIGVNSAARVKIEDIDWCIENSLTHDTEIYALIQGQKSKLYDVVRLAATKPYDKNHMRDKTIEYITISKNGKFFILGYNNGVIEKYIMEKINESEIDYEVLKSFFNQKSKDIPVNINPKAERRKR